MNKYGMTKKKIIHLIADDNRNGCTLDRVLLPAASGSCLPRSQRSCRKMDGCVCNARKSALSEH